MPPPSAEAEAVIVDARGMRCPWPVLRAARAMRREARIVLIADDPVAQRDVPDLARANDWTCTMEDQAGTTRYALSREPGAVAD
jgi:tRNA 2-thiouridine synthesizing protein A